MNISGPYIFKTDGKKRDYFINSSVYMVCNFANENQKLPLIMLCLPLP